MLYYHCSFLALPRDQPGMREEKVRPEFLFILYLSDKYQIYTLTAVLSELPVMHEMQIRIPILVEKYYRK